MPSGRDAIFCFTAVLAAAVCDAATPGGSGRSLGEPQADLAVTVTATPNPVAPGAPLTYILTVTNHGPDASPLTRAFSLVAIAQFVSGPPECQTIGRLVECALGTVAPGAMVSLTLEYLVSDLPMVFNNAHVQGGATDPVPGNNDFLHTTKVVLPPPRAELGHGTRLTGFVQAAEGTAGDFYRLRQQPHSSYEVVVDATSGDIGGITPPLLERLAADASTVLQSAEAVGNGPSRTLRFANTTAAAIDDELVRMRTGAWPWPDGGDDIYQLRAFDTTYSVARFNNAGTQRTVLFVQNPTSRPLAMTATFWSEGGAPLATHGPSTLAARGALVLDLSSVPGVAGTAGSITIVNDAPYGALAGKAVSLEPAAGYSFDTRMEPRPR